MTDHTTASLDGQCNAFMDKANAIIEANLAEFATQKAQSMAVAAIALAYDVAIDLNRELGGGGSMPNSLDEITDRNIAELAPTVRHYIRVMQMLQVMATTIPVTEA